MDFKQVVVVIAFYASGETQATIAEIVKGLRALGVNAVALGVPAVRQLLSDSAGASDSPPPASLWTSIKE